MSYVLPEDFKTITINDRNMRDHIVSANADKVILDDEVVAVSLQRVYDSEKLIIFLIEFTCQNVIEQISPASLSVHL